MGSSGPVSDVDLAHFRVVQHLCGRTFDQDRTLMEYRDSGAEHAHELHIMIDYDHRCAFVDATDHRDQALDFVARHAGRRLIEQHEPGALDQHDADLNHLPLAV